MKQWYVLSTKPHAERRVGEALTQRGSDTYLPQVNWDERKAGQRREPLFPYYQFMRADLRVTSGSVWKWTPGLHMAVSFDGEPAPMPDEAIAMIRRRLEAMNAKDGVARQPFKSGEVVRIKEGSFADFLAVFDEPVNRYDSARTLLQFLGRVNRVTLERNRLERAPRMASQARQRDRGACGARSHNPL